MKKIVILLPILVGVLACDDIVEGDNISGEHVSLLAPSNGVVLESSTAVFSWEMLEEAEQYHLQIATPSFNDALQIVADTTVTTTNFSTSLEANTYEWRVRAENLGYKTEYSTQSFEIQGAKDISDDSVKLLAPINGAVLDTGLSTFSWEELEGAENYQFQIAVPTFSEAQEIITDTIVTLKNVSITLEANTYEWRVRALNSNYQTDYITQSFTVEE